MRVTDCPTPPRAIIFDWDYTLVDSWGTIHAALDETFRSMGQEPWTLEECRVRVRASLRDSFPGLFRERWQEAAEVFYRAYEKDRKSVVWGKSVYVRVDLGGRRISNKKNNQSMKT